MSTKSIVPLIKERREQILLELAPEVTNPELYLSDVNEWHRTVNGGSLFKDPNNIKILTMRSLWAETDFLAEFLRVFTGTANHQERFNLYLGGLWVMPETALPSLGDLSVDKLMSMFGKSREVAEKLKILNDKKEIVEWIAL